MHSINFKVHPSVNNHDPIFFTGAFASLIMAALAGRWPGSGRHGARPRSGQPLPTPVNRWKSFWGVSSLKSALKSSSLLQPVCSPHLSHNFPLDSFPTLPRLDFPRLSSGCKSYECPVQRCRVPILFWFPLFFAEWSFWAALTLFLSRAAHLSPSWRSSGSQGCQWDTYGKCNICIDGHNQSSG